MVEVCERRSKGESGVRRLILLSGQSRALNLVVANDARLALCQ